MVTGNGPEAAATGPAGSWPREQCLAWVRAPGLKDRYELRAGGRRLATLALGGLVVTTATVEAGGDRLHLVVGGMGNQRVTVFEADGGRVVAGLDQLRSGGSLRLADGGRLTWRRSGWLQPTWVFEDRFANPLVRLRPDGVVRVHGAGAVPEPPIGSWGDLLLLLAVGWFALLVGGHAEAPRARSLPGPAREPAA